MSFRWGEVLFAVLSSARVREFLAENAKETQRPQRDRGIRVGGRRRKTGGHGLAGQRRLKTCGYASIAHPPSPFALRHSPFAIRFTLLASGFSPRGGTR